MFICGAALSFCRGGVFCVELLNQIQEVEELARDVLVLSRNMLLLHLRFMDAALIQFIPSDSSITDEIATDGRTLFFNPGHILRSYKSSRAVIARDYLHATLHCVFRHLFVSSRINTKLWDLSCDIAVESMIDDFGLPVLDCPRARLQAEMLSRLREEVRPLTAEKLYRCFKDQEMAPGEYEQLRMNFYADDHRLWYLDEKTDGSGSPDGDSDNEDEKDQGRDIPEERPGSDTEEKPDEGGNAGTVHQGGDDSEGSPDESGSGKGSDQEEDSSLSKEACKAKWKEISERIQVDLDTTSRTWGQSAGDMIQELREVNRERYDYTEFLQRFMVIGENVEINDDDFDPIFYTYGLSLYGNMPLVEPLEFREVRKIREFVIAIDTSESVSGEIVQKFVNKTYNILKQSQNFFTKTNIHIIQCGAAVTEDAKITCQDDFDEYMDRMELHGFGGTDFRPVFEYVDALIREHEFTNFKGLIYFTDGFGTFPADKPDYDAAFVFLDEAREIPDLPVWAIKLMLTEEEIELF